MRFIKDKNDIFINIDVDPISSIKYKIDRENISIIACFGGGVSTKILYWFNFLEHIEYLKNTQDNCQDNDFIIDNLPKIAQELQTNIARSILRLQDGQFLDMNKFDEVVKEIIEDLKNEIYQD